MNTASITPTTPGINYQPFIRASLLAACVFALAHNGYADTTTVDADPFNAVTGAAKPWFRVVLWVIMGLAAVCFLFTVFEAIQQEWKKAFIGLGVTALMGIFPVVLDWIGNQYGFSSGGGITKTLFGTT